MARFFGDKRSPLARLKRGDYDGTAELEALFEALWEVEDLRAVDAAALAADARAEVRALGTRLLLSKQLPGTGVAVFREAAQRSGPARRALLGLLSKLDDDAMVERFAEVLRSGRPADQQVAMEAMLELPSARVMKYLFDFLRAGDDAVRLRVLSKLADERRPGAPLDRRLKLVAQGMLDDRSVKVRHAALGLLLDSADGRFAEVLFREIRLADPGDKSRLVAAAELAVVQDAEAAEAVVEAALPALADGDDRVREAAIILALEAGEPAAVMRRIIVFARGLMGWVRDRILRSMAEHSDLLVDAVAELMGHADADVRRSALFFAADDLKPELVAPCLRLLNDDDWWTRVVAMDSLARVGAQAAVEPLVQCLEDLEVRWSALDALSRLGAPEAFEALAWLMSEEGPDGRAQLVQAIERLSDPRGLALLDARRDHDESPTVREAARLAGDRLRGALRLADNGAEAGASPSSGAEGLRIDGLLREVRRRGASDLHLTSGSRPLVRRHGKLEPLRDTPTDRDTTRSLIEPILGPAHRAQWEAGLDVDLSYEVEGGGRYRVNLFQHHQGEGAVFRVVPDRIPNFAGLGLPDVIRDTLLGLRQGLVLVSGPTGSGKTTTLAAIVDLLNRHRRAHILTLEDPVEYVHRTKRSLVNQREAGAHTRGFPTALRAALRQDPDVIVVGDMRDAETTRLALIAAETGHLVLACTHTMSALKAVTRLVDAFAPREQPAVRLALSESLQLVTCQRLLQRAEGGGRVASFEVLRVTGAVSNLIREGKTAMIPSQMVLARHVGMQTVDDGLRLLLDKGLVTPETAWRKAQDKAAFEQGVDPRALDGAWGRSGAPPASTVAGGGGPDGDA